MSAPRRVGLLIILGLIATQAAIGQQPVVIPGPGSYEGRLEPGDEQFDHGAYFDGYVLRVQPGEVWGVLVEAELDTARVWTISGKAQEEIDDFIVFHAGVFLHDTRPRSVDLWSTSDDPEKACEIFCVNSRAHKEE